MPIARSSRPVGSARLRSLARQLLEASTLCAIATVTPRGGAYISTAYFAWTRAFRIVWLSEPRATHSRNLRANSSAAIAVYDSTQSWGEADRGIQLFGVGRELADGPAARAAMLTYETRFPEHRDADLAAYRVYELRPRRMKLFDERVLGAGTFVTARLAADGEVAWERTEVYAAS
jgi:uncharacterized protein YhbP (UPF0306 family)